MPEPTIREALVNRRMLICVLTGFASGMPLWVVQNLIPAWLRIHGIDLKTIGLFAVVGIPWAWKFLWSPLMDRFVPPFLGRRRGWALVTQIALLFSIAGLGALQPRHDIWTIAYLSMALAFFSASQDIVLDAYRRELLPDEELGIGNAFFVNAYKVSALVPGGLALLLADRLPWKHVFLVTACFMLIGVATTLFMPEPSAEAAPPKTLRAAVVEPFAEFFRRKGVAAAIGVLAFMFLYKLGDNMAIALATPFYIDVGFSLTVIGSTVKICSLVASITGGLVGGILMVKIGIDRALWVFGAFQIVAILGFAALARAGPVLGLLIAVVGLEYLGIGLGSTAFVAFLMRVTDKRFSATQYALFSSFIAVPRTFANATTGFIVERTGWFYFFLICAALAIPGMLLLFKVAPWQRRST